ncbi:hypothetical protein B0H19DRAFT_1386643 [Mycena capillaripes]|nr:hypothetical protein B0H19DRAFT_1386643 [Mycena capillaripes]
MSIRRLVPDTYNTNWREGPEVQHDVEQIAQLLVPDISSCHNLRSLKWYIDTEAPTVEENLIIGAISVLPTLHELEIIVPESVGRYFPFGLLRDLRSISICLPRAHNNWEVTLSCVIYPLAEALGNSPELETLKVVHDIGHRYVINFKYPTDSSSCFQFLLGRISTDKSLRIKHLKLHNDVFHLSEFATQSLVSLDLDTVGLPQVPSGEVQEMLIRLQVAGIFPPELRMPWAWAVDGALFPYLHAHPGLQQVYFNDPQINTGNAHSFADALYPKALFSHMDTLTHLSIHCAFGARDAEAIGHYMALVELSLAIDCPLVGVRSLNKKQRRLQRKIIVGPQFLSRLKFID